MLWGRRRLLAFLLAAPGIVLGAWRARGAPIVQGGAPPAEGEPLAALGAWLDTLLPAEGDSPSATALGCEATLRAKAEADANYRRLLAAGCRWLEAEAARRRSSFAALPEAEREAIAGLALRADVRALPRVFFFHTRRDAFEHYYARPESWPALGFSGPPQPAGFPDHDRPWTPPR